ncbi:hypothetical protein LOTGIDRAFT_168208 [Lottia gigantea]|uniref:BHLH domain-containing protein n=1 Tax=Lottia gigantea TaxID=225164 RepID=V3ZVJ7_LOTGI|nr:hypothetical protein LOTGIDRAFT_168208 [Lottia gigantea]ESO84951.1 hypothetical protein LOTGIDRAFT_168208 [Lottia gigantea]
MNQNNVNNYLEINSMRLTSPSCEELGIPFDSEDELYPMPCRTSVVIKNPSLHFEGLKYDITQYSPVCMIPLPDSLAMEPNFIRRRNERERDRVRCVNEGYERLKEHLPLENKEKRISKVETLRSAIQYIRHLQSLLKTDDSEQKFYHNASRSRKRKSDDFSEFEFDRDSPSKQKK